MSKNLSILLVAISLTSACLLQFTSRRIAYFYKPQAPLAQILPQPLNDWQSVDQPIASTPEIQKAIGELLNFSDGILRVYKKNVSEISVYVAYWPPGKMDPRLIAVHSPDVCWVSGGWQQLGERKRLSLNGQQTAGLFSGHYRTFRLENRQEDVVFWHLIGGQQSRYLELTHGFHNWRDYLRSPFAPQWEQYFIRISSPNLSAVYDDPMLKAIIDSLSAMQSRT